MRPTTQYNYTHTTYRGIQITLNALGEDQQGRNYTQVFVASGEQLGVKVKGVIDPAEGRASRVFDVVAYPTHFTDNAAKYVYAAVPRDEAAAVQEALLVYPSQLLDVYGRAVTEGEEDGEQVGDPTYYYIYLQARITSADDGPRRMEPAMIPWGSIDGAAQGELGINGPATRGDSGLNLEAVRNYLMQRMSEQSYFERVPLEEPVYAYEEDEDGNPVLGEDGNPIPIMDVLRDEFGRPLYISEHSVYDATNDPLPEDEEYLYTTVKPTADAQPVMVHRLANKPYYVQLKPKYAGLVSPGFMSAYGLNPGGGAGGTGGGGSSFNRLDAWADYGDDKSGWVLSAALGKDLYERIAGFSLSKEAIKDALGISDWALKAALDFSDLPDMYWANVPVSKSSSETTTPTFGDTVVGGSITIRNGEKSVMLSVDADGHLCVGGGMYATSFVSAYGKNAGGGEGGGSNVTIMFEGGTKTYTPTEGIITLPAYPTVTSLEWANISNKPFASIGSGLNVTDNVLSVGNLNASMIGTGTIDFGRLPKLYWANIEVGKESVTSAKPTFSEAYIGVIKIEGTNEINTYSTEEGNDKLLYLQYRNTNSVSLCYGGGKVYVGKKGSSRHAYFYYDSENDCLRTNVGIVSDSFISAYGFSDGGEAGVGGAVTIKLGDVEYNASNGVVELPAYPNVLFKRLGHNFNPDSIEDNTEYVGTIYVNGDWDKNWESKKEHFPFFYGQIINFGNDASNAQFGFDYNGELLYRSRWYSKGNRGWTDWKKVLFSEDPAIPKVHAWALKATLDHNDVPGLPASKITSGTIGKDYLPTDIVYLNSIGTAASHNHGDYVTSIGFSDSKLTWSKGGTAQDSITIGYATTAGSATTATTAAKLSTANKTAWGQKYWTNGGVPESIDGDMTNVGKITFKGTIGAHLWYDEENHCIRTDVGFASDSFVTAYGIGEPITNIQFNTGVDGVANPVLSATSSGILQLIGAIGASNAELKSYSNLQLGTYNRDDNTGSVGRLYLSGGSSSVGTPYISGSGSNLVMFGVSKIDFSCYYPNSGYENKHTIVDTSGIHPSGDGGLTLGKSDIRFSNTYTKSVTLYDSSKGDNVQLTGDQLTKLLNLIS